MKTITFKYAKQLYEKYYNGLVLDYNSFVHTIEKIILP